MFFMFAFNPRNLLKTFIDSGFTIKGISKATGIPESLIEKYQGNDYLTQEELQATEYLSVFVAQLYYIDVASDKYLLSLTEVLQTYFDIPNDAISRYIGLQDITLDDFLTSPQSTPLHDNYAKKLVHLYITYIRDKKHS